MHKDYKILVKIGGHHYFEHIMVNTEGSPLSGPRIDFPSFDGRGKFVSKDIVYNLPKRLAPLH
jgi:hypothetical protein